MRGTFSPEALTWHPQRGEPASTGRGEGLPNASAERRWPAVMTPRLAALRADDAVASHRAADGAGSSIEAARTYAHGTSTGAVTAVSCFRPRSVFSSDADVSWRRSVTAIYRASPIRRFLSRGFFAMRLPLLSLEGAFPVVVGAHFGAGRRCWARRTPYPPRAAQRPASATTTSRPRWARPRFVGGRLPARCTRLSPRGSSSCRGCSVMRWLGS
jgi:hypothetical protein